MNYALNDIARLIDHALLNPNLTEMDLERGIQTALRYKVASVCIVPYYLKRCAQLLSGSDTKAGTTIGFPHGGHATDVKVAEAKSAFEDGAEEIDMVVNISQVLSGKWDFVRSEIKALVEVTHSRGKKIKVIFENCYLTDDQKIRLCEICAELSADWAKTSTGFGSGGATIEDVILMRKHLPRSVQIKAAGGIRDLSAVLAFRDLGVTRIGCSRTEEILESLPKS